MNKNILLSFTADSGGLDEATAKLRELSNEEQNLIDKIKDLKKEQATAQFNAKSAEDQTKATIEYGKRIQEVRKELTTTRKTLEDVRAAHQQLEKSVASTVIEKSFRTQRRELEEQLRMMRLNGQTAGEEYDKLLEKLTEMNTAQRDVNAELRNMTTVSFAFDSILQGTQLAAGGYSALTGTMGLFGSKNEDLQQMMVKLQSAIALTTGLQQVQNIVMGEGNIIQRIGVIQTKAKTAAELASTKGTMAAIVQQKIFNFVAGMNPYVLLAMALISVVGALYLFSRNTETAAEKQKRLNALQREAQDLQIQRSDRLKKEGQERIRELEKEYELMQARGASEIQLAAKRDQINRTARQNALSYLNENRLLADSVDENTKKLKEYEKQLADVIRRQREGGLKDTVKQKIVVDEKLYNDEVGKLKEMLQDKIGKVKVDIEIGESGNKELSEAEHKQQVDRENARKRAFEASKKDAVALAEYKVLVAKKGTQEELNAQISAAETRLKNDLYNVDLTKNERLRRTKDTEIEIEQLRNAYRIANLQDDISMINASLSAQDGMNSQVHNLQLARLSTQKEIDLSNTTLTTKARLAIEMKYQSDVRKLTDEYLQHVSELELDTTISSINTRLAKVKQGSAAEYDLKIELAQANAKKEREEVERTIKNEELKAARIKEINAQLQKDISDLVSSKESNGIHAHAEKEILATTQMYEKGTISKRKYENEVRKISIDSIQKEIEARKKYGEDTIDLEKELSDKRIEIAEEEKEARQAMIEELFETFSMFGNMQFDSTKQKLQQELDDLNHFYTTDAEAAKKNKDLKLISEEELARRQLEIKRKQAKAEKEQATFNVLMSTGQAIARAFADHMFPYSAIVAALVGVQAGLQLKAIQSKPLPKYWKGRKGGQGEHALVGEYGPEIMYIPKGASIMPHLDTRRALTGDTAAVKKWSMPAIAPNVPVAPSIASGLVNDAMQQNRFEVDYDKLGRSVAKYQKTPPAPKINVSYDRSGMTVDNNGNKTTYKNSTGGFS